MNHYEIDYHVLGGIVIKSRNKREAIRIFNKVKNKIPIKLNILEIIKFDEPAFMFDMDNFDEDGILIDDNGKYKPSDEI